MYKNLHPSLVRVYSCPNEGKIAYFDETYIALKDDADKAFYAMTASIYRKDELEALRNDLIEIVGDFFEKPRPYWHTTEALHREGGWKKYEELLNYFSHWRDPSFVTCQTTIERKPDDEQTHLKKELTPEENARRECLKQIFKQFLSKEPDLLGLVFEKRQSQEEDDRDKSFLKALRREVEIPDKRAWVSPYDEVALWVPDIVGMAYRHKLVRPSTTSGGHFDRYLAASTSVYEFKNPEIKVDPARQ